MYTLSWERFAHICFLYFDAKSISKNSQESTCARASFLLQLHEKETPVQLLSCEFCETEHLQVTAYVGYGVRLREKS